MNLAQLTGSSFKSRRASARETRYRSAQPFLSWQFRVVNYRYGNDIRMGACIGDRNFRGPLTIRHRLYKDISQFDCEAGHRIQPDMTNIRATKPADANKAAKEQLDGHYPRVNKNEVLSGEPINVGYKHTNKNAQGRVLKAVVYVGRLPRVPANCYHKADSPRPQLSQSSPTPACGVPHHKPP